MIGRSELRVKQVDVVSSDIECSNERRDHMTGRPQKRCREEVSHIKFSLSLAAPTHFISRLPKATDSIIGGLDCEKCEP